MESEKNTEQYLRNCVEQIGGEAYKLVSPNRRFVLDRLCVLPEGIVWFVEVKSEDKKPDPGQYREIIRLIYKGHRACWVKSKKEVDHIIELMKGDIHAKTCNNYNQRADTYILKQRQEADLATR